MVKTRDQVGMNVRRRSRPSLGTVVRAAPLLLEPVQEVLRVAGAWLMRRRRTAPECECHHGRDQHEDEPDDAYEPVDDAHSSDEHSDASDEAERGEGCATAMHGVRRLAPKRARQLRVLRCEGGLHLSEQFLLFLRKGHGHLLVSDCPSLGRLTQLRKTRTQVWSANVVWRQLRRSSYEPADACALRGRGVDLARRPVP